MKTPALVPLFLAAALAHAAAASIAARAADTPPEAIGFIETYALAEDRAEAIEQLVPGTEDFYYFSALLAQSSGRLDEVDNLLEPWVKRHGETARVREIRHRQALLRYPDAPEESLAYLRDTLGLRFEHRQQKLDAVPDLPTELDPDRISWEAFYREAVREAGKDGLDRVTVSGLEHLLREGVAFTDRQRRELLSRIRFPDSGRLVGLIAADLRSKESRGFGEFPIHKRLLPEQLDELEGHVPGLKDAPAFVEVRLAHLLPGADSDPALDPAEREAHLERLWDYVETLPESFDSLRACVLHGLLGARRRKGEYPRDLFLAYLKLPRHTPYMSPDYLARRGLRGRSVNLDADFRATTTLPPIGDDTDLVRAYLLHYFVEDDGWEGFAPYLRETFLKPLFAEAKLVHGAGDPERWYSLINPSAVQELRDRVDIDFAPENPERFAPADAVELDLWIKNVPELLVKVYEINALNYYLDHGREVNTDLPLDGLVASEEKVHRFEDGAMNRVRRRFSFDSMADRRGVWVVEFIGNGLSSRALVRKGDLQLLSRTTAAGVAVTVLDEDNQPVEDAALWFGGREYRAKEEGFVLLPFSTRGSQPVVAVADGFASLERVDFPEENYTLEAGFHLAQESLLAGAEAELALRPDLRLAGNPVPLSLLEEVELTVTTTDLEGVESTHSVEDFELSADREALHRFRVPPRVQSVAVSLSGEVKPVSGGEPVKLQASEDFPVNGIDRTESVADAHLGQFDGKWFVEVLGKSGEPLIDRAVSLAFQHRDFDRFVQVSLKTDEEGRIALGELDGIELVNFRAGGMHTRHWPLKEARNFVPSVLHAAAGEAVQIPLHLSDGKLGPEDLAIFEARGPDGEALLRNAFDRARYDDGLVVIEDLAPGDYGIFLRGQEKIVHLRVTEATGDAAGYALSKARHIEHTPNRPVQIAELEAGNGRLRVRLANARENTRVHVVASRYLPRFNPFASLGQPATQPPLSIARGSNESRYLSGRDIGEEYRYILERRAAKKFPGNLLKRPGLLLNPWELSETDTGTAEAKAGEAPKSAEAPRESSSMRDGEKGSGEIQAIMEADIPPSHEFLAQPARVLRNLAPDDEGVLEVDLDDLGDRQYLQVLAVDGSGAALRSLSLPDPAPEREVFRDLRLEESLDPEKHFTQRPEVTVLDAGESLAVPDLRASEVESYGTLADVHSTLSGLNPDVHFREFAFVLRWPSLEEDRKRELYSEYACHELNFFLAEKDPEFFAAVVRPALANKFDKTFFDHYLLGDDLASYAEPWRFGRLNIVERILLARRLGGDEPEAMARHVADLHEQLPRDTEAEARFFLSALRGRRSAGGLEAATLAKLKDTVPQVVGAAAIDHAGADGFAAPRGGAQTFNRLASKQFPGHPATTHLSPAEPMVAAPEMVAEKAASTAEVEAVVEEGEAVVSNFDDTATDAFGLKLKEEQLLAYRGAARQDALFRKLEETKEWAENNYYRLPVGQQTAELITVNDFWKDFAAWDGEGGFRSRHFPAASGSFAEMMLALAVLDLPFAAEAPGIEVEDNQLTLNAKSPLIVFHQEIEEAGEAAPAGERPPVLVSENFFRNDDRQRIVDGETTDKFVTGEFLTGVLYGAQVVLTNPSSATHRVELILQVPEGAVPANSSEYTRSLPLRLKPFATEKVETFFYFPHASGDEAFAHYPVQVSVDGDLVAWTEPTTFPVVEKLSQFDEASWEYLSQFGEDGEVLDYLQKNNVELVDLSRIAWRARRSVDFYRSVLDLLEGRHAYDATLWSYGLFHNHLPGIRQYLLHREDFLRASGAWIDCELVSVDPVERHWHQQLEYDPLVNARRHRLGRERRILNDKFRAQYQRFMKVLSYRPQLDDRDELAVANYLLLQDRVEEGLAFLDRVEPEGVESRLQLDYLRAYASLYREEPGEAARIADAHADHPVNRWREKFAAVTEQVEEIRGAAGAWEAGQDREADKVDGADGKKGEDAAPNADALTDADEREARQEGQAKREPGFDLATEGTRILVDHQNLDEVTVNYYEMDLEFLFSSQPFVSAGSGQFRYVVPNSSETRELPADGDRLAFDLPGEYAGKNVLVEVSAAGRTESAAVYANTLRARFSENYGRLQVLDQEKGDPLGKVYVKVYARTGNGQVRFLKDGYTDLRGRFDYISLNTGEIESAERLSVLVMSEDRGALVKEVDPPQR